MMMVDVFVNDEFRRPAAMEVFQIFGVRVAAVFKLGPDSVGEDVNDDAREVMNDGR
jgi:hypothetical protein